MGDDYCYEKYCGELDRSALEEEETKRAVSKLEEEREGKLYLN